MATRRKDKKLKVTAKLPDYSGSRGHREKKEGGRYSDTTSGNADAGRPHAKTKKKTL